MQRLRALFRVEGAGARPLQVLSAVLLVLALVQFARVTVFMADPSRRGFALVPVSTWDTRHSCVSAYYVAAEAAGEGRSVYDDSLYSLPSDSRAVRKPRTIGAFNVDVYEYPPPFLLLPRALRLLAPDFLAFRFVWFLLNAAVVLVALVVVARFMGGVEGTRALLLAPLVLAALPMLSALQKGNLQAGRGGLLHGGHGAVRARPAGRGRGAAGLRRGQQALPRGCWCSTCSCGASGARWAGRPSGAPC